MSLVSVKCPNCGASIQLDDSRQEGFCSYCGSKVKVQEAISKIKIDKSGEIQNYLNLASSSVEANNGQEALDYANKALEADSSNANAWYLKMQGTQLLSTLGDLKCQEVITAGNKAISCDNTPDMKYKVYNFFLNTCLNDLRFCMGQMQDTQAIKDLYDANCQLNAFKATENTLNADSIVNMILNQEPSILNLRYSVPNDEISANDELTRLTGEIAKQFVYYQQAINARFNVYGTNMNDEALARYQSELKRIQQGLPQEKQDEIGGDSMENSSKGPCYVATAVYGSYDCPEVWTLRRFRDFSLSQSIFGREFIHVYYALSPSLVRLFGEKKWFNSMFRPVLDKIVDHLQGKGYASTPYKDTKW